MDNLGTSEPSASPALRRFSPVLDADGVRVPALYAGDSLACALGETVFHDLPDDPAAPAEIFRADLRPLRAGYLTVARDLELVDLTDPELGRLGLAHGDVIDTPPRDYSITATWGQAAWDHTAAAGIVWNSRRKADRLAYLLFVDPHRGGDKKRAADRRRDLTVDDPPTPLWDGDGLGAVLTAATDRNVTVIL
jgi:hypothetical protein